MARWTIIVDDYTDRAVRKHFDRHGLSLADLSQFVEAAVLERLYDLTLQEVKTRRDDREEEK